MKKEEETVLTNNNLKIRESVADGKGELGEKEKGIEG